MKKLLLSTVLCLLVMAQVAFAQTRPVKGHVVDENGQPVPAVSVQVKGTEAGTITDINGYFSLEVPEDHNILVISSVGYKTLEVEAGDGLNVLTVQVQHSSNMLNETVIVGYGTETRKTLIGGASTVGEEAFHDVPMGSFTNMLQGKATGVQITAQNGAPGAPAFVRIRGVGSIEGGKEPLYVIDGIPTTSDAYSALNPNDIEDISVLKDASTTSIYGSRGSNGVIIVTTKKGSRGNPKITYGFQYGFKTKTKDNFKMMDFDEKLQYEKDLGYTNQYLAPLLQADGYNSINDAPDPSKYWNMLRPNETNWFDEILRTGHLAQHDLSISGATEKVNYYFSLQSYNEDGISLGSNFNRKSGSMAVDYQANNWLKIGENFQVSYSKSKLLRDIFNAQNPFAAMYFYNPYESPYDFSPYGLGGFNLLSQGYNVVEAIQTNPEWNATLFGLSSTYLELTPINHLKLRSQLGLQYTDYMRESFMQPGSILDQYINGEPTGNKTDNGYNRFNYVWSNTAEYTRTFNQVHNVNLLIGTEFTKDNYKSYSLGSKGYLFPDLTTQNNGTTPLTTTTSRQTWALISYFARAQYNYDQKYMANISWRRDGSSRFGKNVKYGSFVAGGLAWNLTEENFLKGNQTINFLKLWGSVGTSGNDQIGNYEHLPLYVISGYNNQGSIFPDPGSPGNEDLTWEKNTNYSMGIDFVLFNNRLNGTFDYYNKFTHALLLGKPLSPTTGYITQTSNIGNMTNHGIELMLNYNIIKTKNVNWSIGGNITLNKNKVTKLVTDKDAPDLGTFNTYYSIGRPIDVYYMQKYAGIDPNNGDELWYKQDGSTTNDYNEAGLFYLDNKAPNPTYYGGVNTQVSYKGIQLGIDVYYSGGNYIYNNQWFVAHDATAVYQNMAEDAADFWTPTNKNAAYPKPDLNKPTYDSDKWLQKGDFIRLRNVTLAYNLPLSLISKAKMQSLQIYVQAQNLWYYAPHYKGDPEVGIGSDETGYTVPGTISLYSYPQTRAITFGLNVTF